MNSGQESISTITDSLNALIDTKNKTVEIQNDKGTVNFIMNRNINNLEEYLNTKVINIYQRPWNKLELKLKTRKIDEYFRDGPFITELPPSSPSGKKSTKKGIEAFGNYDSSQISSFCKSNEKKRLKIEYDQQTCTIISILVLN